MTERERLVAAIEREVSTLAGSASRLTSGPGSSFALAGDTVDIPAGLGVEHVGAHVARSVWAACHRAVGSQGAPQSTPAVPPRQVNGSSDVGRPEKDEQA